MNRLQFKTYSSTIRVQLSADHLIRDPGCPDRECYLVGYYQSISVYAASEADAVATLKKLVSGGRIDWSRSDLIQIDTTWLDRIKVLLGYRVKYKSGRAFFPPEADGVSQGEGPGAVLLP